MNILKFAATVFAFTVSANVAQAASFTFSGDISTHKDVIYVPFTLDEDAINVKVWTDSYLSGVNFDPITAVWMNGSLIGQNDDNSGIAPGQTIYDSGLTFASLAAGDYLFTIATYNNFANGSQLSEGFRFDGQAPIALADWCQPFSHCAMGSHWVVHLDGVSSATPPIPEPETYAMLLAGMGLIGLVARRRKNKA